MFWSGYEKTLVGSALTAMLRVLGPKRTLERMTRNFRTANNYTEVTVEALAEKEPRAAYDLGLRYFRGDGVRQDSYKALSWMRSAAERGHLEAQKALGRFYLTGLEEMGSDPREAEKWLSIAASRGDAESGRLLAEAGAARKSDEDYWKWQQRWRGVFYDHWYRRYPYLGHWRDGYWYYR